MLVYNAHFDVVNFTLPAVPDGANWMGLIDTNQPEAQLPAFSFGEHYAVTGRSLLVFALAAGHSMTRRLRHGMESILDAVETPL